MFVLECRIKGNLLLSMPRNHLWEKRCMAPVISLKLNVVIGLLLCTASYCFEISRRKDSLKFSLPDASRRKVFPTFREITLSPSPGFAGGLVEPKLISFGCAKPPAYLENGDRVNMWK